MAPRYAREASLRTLPSACSALRSVCAGVNGNAREPSAPATCEPAGTTDSADTIPQVARRRVSLPASMDRDGAQRAATRRIWCQGLRPQCASEAGTRASRALGPISAVRSGGMISSSQRNRLTPAAVQSACSAPTSAGPAGHSSTRSPRRFTVREIQVAGSRAAPARSAGARASR
jgi:hypothetical protein